MANPAAVSGRDRDGPRPDPQDAAAVGSRQFAYLARAARSRRATADRTQHRRRFHTFARALADRWRVQDPGRIRYRMEWPRWRPAPIDADGAADGTARVGRRDEPAARIRVDPGARRRRSGATLLLGGRSRRGPSPSKTDD